MADPVSLHKPMEILDPAPWEISLQQLRALMKNVITNHDRIRERVIELKDRYYDGQMGDGAVNWERWAVNHFAYSPRYLRALSSPHPLQIDKWEAQRLRAAERERQINIANDKKRTQEAWDEWREEQKREQEEIHKKEAKRLYNKEKQRVYREVAKQVPVAHKPDVVKRVVEEYQALPRSDQKVVLALIGAQPLRRPKKAAP